MNDDHVLAAVHVLDEVREELTQVKRTYVTGDEVAYMAAIDLDKRRSGKIVGLPWPPEWSALGRRLGPIEPSSLTIIAARPSVGKTIFGLQLTRHLGSQGKSVLFVSRELSPVRIWRRQWAAYGASLFNLRIGRPTETDLEAIRNYDRDRIAWDVSYDAVSTSVAEVTEQADILRPDIVIIDYLQRFAYDTEKEYAAITRIANELQDFTLASSIPVVCLSQLSRPMKGMEWKAPSMSDTRGSGAVEERAANLIILHRFLDNDEDEGKKVVGRTASEKGWFIVAKNADGETGHPIPVLYDGARMRIVEQL